MKKRYIYKFLIIFILSLFYSAFNIGILAYINKFILRLDSANLIILVGFLVLLILFFISLYVVAKVISTINNSLVYELRVRFVNRVLHTKMIFDEKKPKILASLSKDITNISNGFMRLGDILQGLMILILSLFYFSYLSLKLAIFIGVWFIIVGVVMFYFINQARISYILSRKYDDVLYKNYEELLAGFKELRISQNRQDRFLEKFLNSANIQKDANINAEVKGNIARNFLNVMILGGIGMVMYLSLGLGVASFETATTLSLSIMFLRTPFIMMISSLPSVLVANISLKKVKELDLIKFEDIDFSIKTTPLSWKKLEFKDISFKYDKNLVLDRINLTIKKGETIFLIGKNGSGKSTLFLLMCGLLKPSSGEILVDGKALDSSNLARFQNSLSVVFADFYLFSEILNSDKKIINYWIKVLRLEDRIKFNIEENRVKFSDLNLSTGQKKRLALLENLIENRDFLMLDEFAADQDPEFREHFYTHILPLLKSKNISVFAISHDDKYFDMADKIYKIENGNLKQI